MPLIPALIVAVPLGAAAVLGGANRYLPTLVREVLSVGAAVTVTVLAAVLLSRSASHPVVLWFGGWRPVHGTVIGVDYVVDPLGAGLALLAGLLATGALFYSRRFFDEVGGRYPALVLIFTAASVDFAFSGDLFNMFVAFELVAVSAFVLSGFYAEREAPLQGAINFAVTNTLGGLLLLAGLIFLYGRTGTLNLAEMGATLAGHRADGLVVVAFALVAAGFLTKAAVVPFHFWLPDAYGTAPVPACILFAGVLSELGLFGLARVWETVFSASVTPVTEAHLRIVLCSLGVLTALVGTAMSLVQRRLRRLLGFVTVAHMGLYVAGFGLLRDASLGGVALLALGDGLVKAALFLAAGVVQKHRPGAGPLSDRQRKVLVGVATVSIAVGALSLADLPPFATSAGKDLMVAAAGAGGWWLETLVGVTVVGTGAAVLRAAVRAWADAGLPSGSLFPAGVALSAGGEGLLDVGRVPGRAQATAGEEAASGAPSPAGGGDASGGEQAASGGGEAEEEEADNDELATGRTLAGAAALVVTPVALLAVALAIGLVPHLDERFVRAAAVFVDRRAYAARVLRGRSLPVVAPVVPAGSSLTVPLDLLEAAASVALTVALLARRAVLVRGRRRAAAGVAWLRHLHSGHVGDEVTWQVLGVAVLAGLSALALR